MSKPIYTKPKRVNYRKIWSDVHGTIPIDEFGRSYEIHHIDGNRNNNHIDNLIAVSIQDHYDIHYKQGDYRACALIGRKMKISHEELSKLARFHAKGRVKNGTHPFQTRPDGNSVSSDRVKNGTFHLLKREDGTSNASDKVANGIHHFQTRPDGNSVSSDRVKNGTHNFQTRPDGTNLQTDRVKNGTNPFQTRKDGGSIQKDKVKDGTHPLLSKNRASYVCDYCGIIGRGNNILRYHFDNCLYKNKILVVTFPDGHIENIHNIEKFCNLYKLTRIGINRIIYGIRKTYNGFKFKLEENNER